MLPQSYQSLAAVVLVVGGLLACFAGYRLFRGVLALYGFILGALVATSAMGTSDTTSLLLAALVGGLIGAVILFLAYFAGVALVGAGLGAFAAHLVWTQLGGDPHPLIVILFAVVGAIAAMSLQRYVIIFGTSIGGAWTIIVGALALAGNRSAMAAAEAGDVWVVYPFDPRPGERWVIAVWLIIAVVGIATQFGLTARSRRK